MNIGSIIWIQSLKNPKKIENIFFLLPYSNIK